MYLYVCVQGVRVYVAVALDAAGKKFAPVEWLVGYGGERSDGGLETQQKHR